MVGIQLTRTPMFYPLDPQERDILSVYNLMYEGLVSIDDNYQIQPCLAQRWEESNGGRTWTFHLREDLFFSDNTPVTAQDVVASMEYILTKAGNENAADKGFYRNLSYFVSSVSANGEHTVVVKAKRKYYGLLYAMTFPILKASQVAAPDPVGTGPYKMENRTDSAIFLVSNEYCWRQDPQVQNITFMRYETPGAVLENYQYARVDAIFSRSLAAAQYKTGVSNVTVRARTNQLECLIMNLSASPLDDVRIRQAIRYLIDPEALMGAYSGMVTRTDLPVVPGTWAYNDSLEEYFQPNFDAAVRLL